MFDFLKKKKVVKVEETPEVKLDIPIHKLDVVKVEETPKIKIDLPIHVHKIKSLKLGVIEGNRDDQTRKGLKLNPKLIKIGKNRGLYSHSDKPFFSETISSSFVNIDLVPYEEGIELKTDLIRTPYYFAEALRIFVNKSKSNPSLFKLMSLSPHMAYVSLLTIVKDNVGVPYFLSSLRSSPKFDSGELHASTMVSPVSGNYLVETDPLMEALKKEYFSQFSEELILEEGKIPDLLFDGFGFGFFNMTYVVGNTIDNFLEVYKKNPFNSQVKGFSCIPFDARLSEDGSKLENIVTFIPDKNGVVKNVNMRDVAIKAYTAGILNFVKDSSNKDYLLKRAGF